MGGARLKSKYQTKEVYRNVEGSQTTEDVKKPPMARVQKKKGSNKKDARK